MGQAKDRKGRRRGPEYRALVTGDRNWAAPEVTERVLNEYAKRFPRHRMRIIEGGAKGADAAAAEWAKKRRGADHIQVPAQWSKYGRNAGPMRNRKMLREYDPDAVLGFHDDISRSKGTKHMIGLVTGKGHEYSPREVRIYNSKGERTFKQGADLDPDQLKFIRRQQRREQKMRRKNNPAAKGEGVVVFKSLAELGEISKAQDEYKQGRVLAGAGGGALVGATGLHVAGHRARRKEATEVADRWTKEFRANPNVNLMEPFTAEHVMGYAKHQPGVFLNNPKYGIKSSKVFRNKMVGEARIRGARPVAAVGLASLAAAPVVGGYNKHRRKRDAASRTR